MSTVIILSVLCCLLFSLSAYLSWKVYRFSMIIIDMEDALEESLEILNNKYSRMNEIIQTPVFFDSIEVRQVIAEIKDCHRAVLVIANKLTRQSKELEDLNETKEEDS